MESLIAFVAFAAIRKPSAPLSKRGQGSIRSSFGATGAHLYLEVGIRRDGLHIPMCQRSTYENSAHERDTAGQPRFRQKA